MNYQQLRQEAEKEAQKILGKTKKLGKKDLDPKESITKTFQRSKHVLLKQSDIDHCVNNGLDVTYLYDEMDSKWGGKETVKKSYYIPRGNPKGRPKKDINEQEQ